MSDRITVTFIGGSDRSGSTLLDLLLGRLPRFVSVGELRWIWERGFQRNQLCGCRVPFRDCRFWTQVVEEAFGGFDGVDAAGVVRLKGSVERMRAFPQVGMRALRDADFRARLERYASMLEKLYAGVAMVSGATVIVDSSKHPSHGFVLSEVRRIDLRVIHLVRDSRAVAYSLQRRRRRHEVVGQVRYMPTQPAARAALTWDLRNGMVQLLGLKHRRYLRLRYEDLAADPIPTVAELVEGMGLGTPDLSSLQAPAVNHTISGNPIRLSSGPLEVRPDLEWRRSMGAGHRLGVTALTWPFLVGYGYALR